MKRIGILVSVALLLCMVHAIAFAELLSIPIGTGTTEDKPQSKLWFHDGDWWAIMPDGFHLYFYRMIDGIFVKQTSASAMVDIKNGARADVLSVEERLYVLIYKGTWSSFAEYTYDSGSKSYVRIGLAIPVKLAKGVESATIARDSVGVLWVAYEAETNIYVIRSADHKTWSAPVKLNTTPVDPDDIADVIAFDHNKIGVMWSDHLAVNFAFRVHHDGDPVTVWDAEEVVSQGNDIADDHIHLAITPTQDILAVTKSGTNDTINFFIRWSGSTEWIGPYKITANATRPIVLYDEDNAEIYIFYTAVKTRYNPADKIVYKHLPIESLVGDLNAVSAAPVITLFEVAGVAVNNVTSTKDNVNAETDIVVAAKGGTNAYYARIPVVVP